MTPNDPSPNDQIQRPATIVSRWPAHLQHDSSAAGRNININIDIKCLKKQARAAQVHGSPPSDVLDSGSSYQPVLELQRYGKTFSYAAVFAFKVGNLHTLTGAWV